MYKNTFQSKVNKTYRDQSKTAENGNLWKKRYYWLTNTKKLYKKHTEWSQENPKCTQSTRADIKKPKNRFVIVPFGTMALTNTNIHYHQFGTPHTWPHYPQSYSPNCVFFSCVNKLTRFFPFFLIHNTFVAITHILNRWKVTKQSMFSTATL